MRYVAWDAGLNKPMKTGGSVRDNLEDAAEKGNPTALRLLTGPPRPLALRHLWLWHASLQQGLGEGLSGKGMLDWVKFDAWTRSMRVDVYPNEVQALFLLDLLARRPESLKDILKEL